MSADVKTLITASNNFEKRDIYDSNKYLDWWMNYSIEISDTITTEYNEDNNYCQEIEWK